MPAIMRLNQPPLGTFRTAEERNVVSMVAKTTKNSTGKTQCLRQTVSITCGLHHATSALGMLLSLTMVSGVPTDLVIASHGGSRPCSSAPHQCQEASRENQVHIYS